MKANFNAGKNSELLQKRSSASFFENLASIEISVYFSEYHSPHFSSYKQTRFHKYFLDLQQ